VTRADSYVSWSPNEEFAVVPDEELIERAVRDVAE